MHRLVCKGAWSHCQEETMRVVRIGLCLIVVSVLLQNARLIDHIDILEPGECIRDYTFDIVATKNQYIRENKNFTLRWMTVSNYLMDFTQVIGVVAVAVEKISFKNAFAFGLFFPLRQLIQGIFLMRRLPGWTWYDTGYFSLTVPFHDTNDFYYSGHLGVCVLWIVDFYSNKYYVMVLFTLLNALFQWYFLSITNAHYIIDLVSGVFVAHLFTILGEPLSFFFDVMFTGWSHK